MQFVVNFDKYLYQYKLRDIFDDRVVIFLLSYNQLTIQSKMIQNTFMEIDTLNQKFFVPNISTLAGAQVINLIYKISQHLNNLKKHIENVEQPTRTKLYEQLNKIGRIILYRSSISNTQEWAQMFNQILSIKIDKPQISYFFNNEQFPNMKMIQQLSKNQEEVQDKSPTRKSNGSLGIREQIERTFFQNKQITHLQLLLLKYPKFFSKKRAYNDVLLRQFTKNTNLDLYYYFFLLGAAEYGCKYLISHMIPKYIEAGGKIQQLKGNRTPKLQKLLKLNHYLAHCPWKITPSLLQDIMTSWNIDMLFLLSQVMCFSHFLSIICLIFGLKIQEPQQCQIDKFFNTQFLDNYKLTIPKKPPNLCLEDISNSLKYVLSSKFQQNGRRSNHSEEEEEKQLQNISSHMLAIDKEIVTGKKYNQMQRIFSPIILCCDGNHQRDEKNYSQIFEAQWSSEDHAYPKMHKLSPKTSNHLINLINEAKNLRTPSKYALNKTNVSNRNYRKSALYYSDTLLGFVHESYDYPQNMKKMLSLQDRFFIMIITEYPFLADHQLLDYIPKQGESLAIALNMVLMITGNKMDKVLSYLIYNLSDLCN